jgi:hypothetical protein
MLQILVLLEVFLTILTSLAIDGFVKKYHLRKHIQTGLLSFLILSISLTICLN